MKSSRLYSLLVVMLFTVCCTKDSDTPEQIFYGNWVGDQSSDTIRFFNRDGSNILKVKQVWSFISGEREFEYRDEKLRLKDTISEPFHTLDEFRWINKGRSFEVRRANIYPVSFDYLITYVKIQDN